MSTPYKRLMEATRPAVEPAPPRPEPSYPKKLASAAKQRRVEKPLLRFNIRPRFRFDLPEPPMDPKMLLGTLSAASYAKPHVLDLERDFHPTAVASEPTHGLRANLVDMSMYKTPAALTPEDEMLLDSVIAGRSNGNLLSAAPAARRGSQRGGSKLSSRQSDVPSAPWMRRMAYDEYETNSGRQSMRRADGLANKRAAEVSAEELEERKRRALRQSFKPMLSKLKHPDRRKHHLKPVKITPVHPGFHSLLEDIVAIEFDKDDQLTLPERARKDPEAAEQSVRTTATVSVAERHRRTAETEKKFVACYTPTNRTLMKRKRKRDEVIDAISDDKEVKKIYFVDDEKYQWNGEYSIRERKYEEPGRSEKPVRSCAKLVIHSTPDGKSSIATCNKIGTIWKLARRTLVGEERLGKDGLNIAREADPSALDGDLLRKVLTGRFGVKD